MGNNPIFWFFVGGLVLWIAEWIYDIYLWRRQQANNAPLLTRASSAESQALSLQSDLNTHQSKLSAFELQVSDLNSRLGTANASAAEFEHKHASLNIELDKLKQKMAGMVEKKALEAATAESSSLKAQLAIANQSLAALKPSAEKAANLEKELASLKTSFESSAKKSDLDTANAEITSLKARILSYSNQTQEFIDAKTRINYLETELNDSKAKLTTELDGAKTKNTALEAEINKLKSDGVLLMTERLAPALARIQFLEAEQSKPSDTSDTTDSADLKAKLAALEVEHSTLQGQVSSHPELEAKLGALEAELATAKGTLKYNMADMAALQLQVSNANAQIAALSTKTPATDEPGNTSRIQALEAELNAAKNAASHNTSDMAGMKIQLANLNEELTNLKADSGSSHDSIAEIARLKAEIAELVRAPKAPLERDRLEKIDGIGDVYEHRLNAAGIWSFQQLSEMNVEAILNLIQPEAWQQIEPEKWILEASERAKAKTVS